MHAQTLRKWTVAICNSGLHDSFALNSAFHKVVPAYQMTHFIFKELSRTNLIEANHVLVPKAINLDYITSCPNVDRSIFSVLP